MDKPIVRIALLCASLPLAACSDDLLPDTFDCPDIGIAAVAAEVKDAATGAPLGGATLTLRDGAQEETGGGPNAPSTIVAGHAPGTYDVRVSRAGYLDWTHNDVRVDLAEGECPRPNTVALTVNLVRAP